MSQSSLQIVLARQTTHPQGDGESLWLGGGAGVTTPTERLAVLLAHRPEPVSSWLDNAGYRLATVWRRRHDPTKALRMRAEAIVEQTRLHSHDDDEALRLHLRELVQACRLAGASSGSASQFDEDSALAGVLLAVERTLGFKPYVEQVMGALALLEGQMAEMATGEGKTLTAAMAAIAAAWRGLPCHVVTANDYLARRDAELGQPLFAFCHLSAASLDGDMPPTAREAAHRHDIVYSTAKELLADHLRDGLALGKTPSGTRMALNAARQGGRGDGPDVVMRGIFQVIVDEADSVLIDEAVTPLIISTQRPDDFLDQAAQEAVRLSRQLKVGIDFRLERALRHVELTPHGRQRLQQMTHDLAPFWRHRDRARELVEMALFATELMSRDQHYVVEDGKVILVDELTGRLALQRTLSLGMQQVLEASQGLTISSPTEVSARLSFQRFFRLFDRLGGMTGTAQEARSEFAAVYRLFTLRIPTHRPVCRSIWPTRVCSDEKAKFDAIAKSVFELLAAGRAVLVGMRSVRTSTALYEHLLACKPDLQVQLLHAIHHAQESAIVAQAGRDGALTIATNMAGRGTDIKLEESVRASGGLHVIIGESNDYERIDRQLVGRCARQGDPGSVQRFIAFDEEVVRRFAPAWLRRLWPWLHARARNWRPLLAALVLRQAQSRAERLAFQQRKNILKQDVELDRSGF